ncbi:MAG: heme o synthase [Actinomycetota bacterium]
MGKIRFPQFAWGLVAYTVAVIVGGGFVRASRSGDGCGQHWPNCHGQLIPDASQLKTMVEFGHRASTAIYGLLVLALVAWAFRSFKKEPRVYVSALAVLLFTLVEAWIGRHLVMAQLVGTDQSLARAFWMSIHLVNTFLLLGAATLTAWWGSGGKSLAFRGQGAMLAAMLFGLGCTLVLGMSGAITALGDTLFPATSLIDGVREDFSASAHFLKSVRPYHPLIAASAGLVVLLGAALAMKLRPSEDVQRHGRLVIFVFLCQMAAGLLNLAMLAPIWMQLIHLALADLFWISQVLLASSALAVGVPRGELSTLAPVSDDPAPKATWKDYLALTKPRVISLLLFTALTAMPIAARSNAEAAPSLLLYLAVAVGLYMAAGAANAINMVLERDLDLAMGRTATRPTVTDTVPARAALKFAFLLMVGSFAILWGAANLLCAMLALAGLAFYVIVYTLLLKRRTWTNIVIGGAAGAFPPLVGWSAVTGDLSPLAWCLFGIIFLWTPVHFWALALLIKEDYAGGGVPMLPVIRGDRATVVQIAYYAVLTAAISAAPLMLHGRSGQAVVGWWYVAAAVLLNAMLLFRSLRLYQRPDRPLAKSLFKYSMVYLALLFLAMALDGSRGL